MKTFIKDTTTFKNGYFYVYDAIHKTFSEFFDEDKAIDKMEKLKGVLFYCCETVSAVTKKAIFDFDKKVLTLTDNCNKYSAGTNPLDESDYQNWEKLLLTFKNQNYNIEIKGTPYFEGRDITNEMSDL